VTVNKKKGFLILIGGAEDRRNGKDVLRKVADLANANNVIVIPTATSEPQEAVRDYADAFKNIGVPCVQGFHIKYRDEADRFEFLEMVDEADLFFFTGGDQVRLVHTLRETRVINRIWEKYLNGATIAGTSAGASAAGDLIVYDGEGYGFKKGSVHVCEGFGFLKDTIIDTHFMERERIPRLIQFLSSRRRSRGIGLSENTAIIVGPDNRFEVFGKGMVVVMNGENMSYTNYSDIRNDQQFSTCCLDMGFLASGAIFDMN